MNFKTLATISMALCLAWGASFLFIPEVMGARFHKGLNMPPADIRYLSALRHWGCALLMLGAVMWALRSSSDAALQQRVGRCLMIPFLAAAASQLYSLHVAAVNSFGWTSVVIYLVLSVLWARVGWAR